MLMTRPHLSLLLWSLRSRSLWLKIENGDMVMKLDIKHAYDKTSLLVLDKDVLNCHLILDT